MPTLAELRNHLTRAVYSLPFSGDLVKDVVLKNQSFQIHLKPRVPYGYTADLTRRLENINGVVISGMDTSPAEILIRGHFDPNAELRGDLQNEKRRLEGNKMMKSEKPEHFCVWNPFANKAAIYEFSSAKERNAFVNTMRIGGHKEARPITKEEACAYISNGASYYDADTILDHIPSGKYGLRIE